MYKNNIFSIIYFIHKNNICILFIHKNVNIETTPPIFEKFTILRMYTQPYKEDKYIRSTDNRFIFFFKLPIYFQSRKLAI
jgi:hypothetical protein